MSEEKIKQKPCACNKQIVWFFEKATICACKKCEITFHYTTDYCPYCKNAVSYFEENEDLII